MHDIDWNFLAIMVILGCAVGILSLLFWDVLTGDGLGDD
jgi:hypothetical protein